MASRAGPPASTAWAEAFDGEAEVDRAGNAYTLAVLQAARMDGAAFLADVAESIPELAPAPGAAPRRPSAKQVKALAPLITLFPFPTGGPRQRRTTPASAAAAAMALRRAAQHERDAAAAIAEALALFADLSRTLPRMKNYPSRPRALHAARLQLRRLRHRHASSSSPAQIALDKDGNVVGRGDLRAQTVQVLENVKACLAAAGATFADVVKLNTYVVNLKAEDLPIIREVRSAYLPAANPPASTMVGVTRPRHRGAAHRDRSRRRHRLGTRLTSRCRVRSTTRRLSRYDCDARNEPLWPTSPSTSSGPDWSPR